MAISSNAIFHFTKNMDNLLSIVKSQCFLPRYCVEYDKGKIEDNSYYAIPMVCFCDIPLSQIKEHTTFYGSYGIGMSKPWARGKISPVIYYNDKQSLSKSLYDQVSKQLEIRAKIKWFSLLKLYYGKTWSNKKKKYIKKVLYNEREWRYVPRQLSKELCVKRVVDPSGFNAIQESVLLKEYPLEFNLQDIKYIFISKDDERSFCIDQIIECHGDTPETRLLCSKILSIKQIKEDF